MHICYPGYVNQSYVTHLCAAVLPIIEGYVILTHDEIDWFYDTTV